MADVFISYHEESAGELAEQIADALDAAGISAWCARRDMTLGGNFAREIPNQIHDCRLFLLILNDNVYHSEHIENEVGIAFSRVNKKENILILPLELGNFTRKDWVEYYLIHTQGVKFPAQPNEKRLQRLVKQVAKALNRETQPALIPQATPEPPPVKIIKRGQCGDNVNYTLNENGVLTIFGDGSMWDFKYDSNLYKTPWREERETIVRAEIQDGVTTIGDGAFYPCHELTSVTVPNSMTIIGADAFNSCTGLTSVTIPNRVTRIGGFAFHNCSGLTSITIPDSVTEIGWDAFKGCTGLTNVAIPNSVKKIEDDIFMNCTGLTSVIIPGSVTEIGRSAFFGCRGLTSVTIPDSVTKIGHEAFLRCTGLTSVSIPATAEIEKSSFPDNVRITRRE